MKLVSFVSLVLALGLLAIVLALGISIDASVSKAYAAPNCAGQGAPFTDPNGAMCCTGQTVAGPGGVGTYCPGSSPSISASSYAGKLGIAFSVGGARANWSNYDNTDDPTVQYSRRRIDPLSATGAPVGGSAVTPGATTYNVDAEGDAHVVLPAFKSQQGYQFFSIGPYFNYDNMRTIFSEGTTLKRDEFEGGLRVQYGVRSSYLIAQLGGVGGDGSVRYSDSSSGNFGSLGLSGQVIAGNTFTLFDQRTTSALVTKGDKKDPITTGGYVVNFDLAGRTFVYNETVDSFQDSSGFVRGTEEVLNWGVGVRGRLSASVFSTGYVWTPSVDVTFDQQLRYFDKLSVPIQSAAVTPGVVNYGTLGRSTFGTQGGLDVMLPSQIRVGATIFYNTAARTDELGGRVYVKLPIATWFAISRN